MGYKNEDKIKDMIVDGHNRGVCDRNGASVTTMNFLDQRVVTAKPRSLPSTAKTYIFKDGEMVLKE